MNAFPFHLEIRRMASFEVGHCRRSVLPWRLLFWTTCKHISLPVCGPQCKFPLPPNGNSLEQTDSEEHSLWSLLGLHYFSVRFERPPLSIWRFHHVRNLGIEKPLLLSSIALWYMTTWSDFVCSHYNISMSWYGKRVQRKRPIRGDREKSYCSWWIRLRRINFKLRTSFELSWILMDSVQIFRTKHQSWSSMSSRRPSRRHTVLPSRGAMPFFHHLPWWWRSTSAKGERKTIPNLSCKPQQCSLPVSHTFTSALIFHILLFRE